MFKGLCGQSPGAVCAFGCKGHAEKFEATPVFRASLYYAGMGRLWTYARRTCGKRTRDDDDVGARAAFGSGTRSRGAERFG